MTSMSVARTDPFPIPGVLTEWFPLNRPVRWTPIRGGFSGDSVWRIDVFGSPGTQSSPESYAFKSSTPGHARGDWIDRVVVGASANCPIVAAPLPSRDGRLAITTAGTRWQCFPWRNGRPLPPDAPATAIHRGVAAIAQFHLAAANSGADPWPGSPTAGSPRSVRERIERLEKIPAEMQQLAAQGGFRRDGMDPVLAAAIDRASGHLRAAVLRGRVADLVDRLKSTDPATPKTIVLRDIHRDHILFGDDRQVAGLIDWDAVDFDSPAADLARWLAGFRIIGGANFCDDVVRAAAEYQRFGAFSERQIDLTINLMPAGILGALANWVQWITRGQRSFAAPPRTIADRIDDLNAAANRIC